MYNIDYVKYYKSLSVSFKDVTMILICDIYIYIYVYVYRKEQSTKWLSVMSYLLSIFVLYVVDQSIVK